MQFLFPENCSTCFGWYLHPSSGARVNSNYNIWHWSNRITTLRSCGGVRTDSSDSSTTAEGSNTVRSVLDAVITVYTCSWWWVKVSPEICRAVCREWKLYIVASCWTVIDISPLKRGRYAALKRRLGNYHATLGRIPNEYRSRVACATLRKSLNGVKENIKQRERDVMKVWMD